MTCFKTLLTKPAIYKEKTIPTVIKFRYDGKYISLNEFYDDCPKILNNPIWEND